MNFLVKKCAEKNRGAARRTRRVERRSELRLRRGPDPEGLGRALEPAVALVNAKRREP